MSNNRNDLINSINVAPKQQITDFRHFPNTLRLMLEMHIDRPHKMVRIFGHRQVRAFEEHLANTIPVQ